MHTYMMYNNCMTYETDPFNTGAGGSTADFIWMLIICMFLFGIYAAFQNERVLSTHICYTIVYVQSRRSPESPRSIFGFKFKNAYIPWVYVAINVLMSNPIVPCIMGIVVGHIYFHLVDTVPKTNGFEVIRTPQFCEDIARLGGDPQAAARAPAAAAGFRPTGAGRMWGSGRGNVLGSR
jgi:Derlin-2/3